MMVSHPDQGGTTITTGPSGGFQTSYPDGGKPFLQLQRREWSRF